MLLQELTVKIKTQSKEPNLLEQKMLVIWSSRLSLKWLLQLLQKHENVESQFFEDHRNPVQNA